VYHSFSTSTLRAISSAVAPTQDMANANNIISGPPESRPLHAVRMPLSHNTANAQPNSSCDTA